MVRTVRPQHAPVRQKGTILALALMVSSCSSADRSTSPGPGELAADTPPGNYQLPDGSMFKVVQNVASAQNAPTYFCQTHSAAGPLAQAYTHVQQHGPGCRIEIR